MSHIETGNTKLSLPVFVKIAEALDVQTDALLYDSPRFSKSVAAERVQKVLDLSLIHIWWEYHPGDGQFMVDAAYHAAVEPLIKELDIKDLSNVGNSATADHIDSLKGITTKIRGIRRLDGA